MNRSTRKPGRFAALLLAGLSGSAALGQSDVPAPAPVPAVSAADSKAAHAAEIVRIGGMLSALQADPTLAPRIPQAALADARSALARASSAQNDADTGPYLMYIADRKVQLARALAQTAYAQEQYQQLAAQRDRSPNAANYTQIAPSVIDTPQQEELQRGAAALHPSRDRGALKFSITDVLVLPGTITLTRDTSNALVPLSVYLRRNPQSQLLLVGYARGDAAEDAVQRVAQARADGIRNYLMRLGVQVEQITLQTKVSADVACANCVDAWLDPPWATQRE